jgi:hypothetical protein
MAKINHAANIGKPTVQDVTEDATKPLLVAAGMITISDQDSGEAFFRTTVISQPTNLGQLTINANGSYTYSVQNAQGPFSFPTGADRSRRGKK